LTKYIVGRIRRKTGIKSGALRTWRAGRAPGFREKAAEGIRLT
jgi:hypothetical protein